MMRRMEELAVKGAEAGQHIAITIGNMCTNDLIASALSKGIFYQTTNDSPLCDSSDGPLNGTSPLGDTVYWIPGDGGHTTWANQSKQGVLALLQ